MEKQLQEPVQSPWLLYLSRREKEQVFCSASQSHHTFRDRIPVLWNKIIWNYTYGWILLSSGDISRFMLFNPNTRQIVHLPVLLSKPNRHINAGILWLSPENPMSKVLLFDVSRTTIIFCSLHKKQWIEASYRTQAKKIVDGGDGYLTVSHPVTCNGRLYALLLSRPYKLVEINIQEEARLQIKSLGSELPVVDSHSSSLDNYRWWLAESQGDLFAINVVCGGVGHAEAIDVGVFRWDFDSSEKGWRDVKGSEIKDRAFFLSCDNRSVSCAATGQEFEGGRVYFITESSKNLYSFDIEDGSMTMSSPSRTLYPFLWVMMPNSRENTEETVKKKKRRIESLSDPLDVKRECKWVNFLDLQQDIMEAVAKKLTPADYMNLRATCKTCCQLAPPFRRRASSSVHKQLHSLPPWLMFSKSDRTMHHFIDLKFESKFTIGADSSLYGAKIRYSKDGWVLMTNIDENSFFFYSPFIKEVIKLPEAPEESAAYDSFCFTSIPSSPECVVMGVTSGSACYFDMRQQQWSLFYFQDLGGFPNDLSIHNTPVFFKGAFYILDTEGSLNKLILESESLTVFDEIRCPCEDFYQNFLLEWDGKLTSVFIDRTWTLLQVFTLNEATMEWEEVSSLSKCSFFLSSFSAFSVVTNIHEMENKVYLSKIYGEDKVIFYCLKSRRYGYTTSKETIESFCDAKDYLSSCWIEPSWDSI